MRPRTPAVAWAICTLVVVALGAPSAARSATTCDFGSGVLEVRLTQRDDHAVLQVSPSGRIVVSPFAGTALACVGAAPTVTSTAAISIFNLPGTGRNRVDVLGPRRFAPGAGTAGEGTPEIELFVNLNDDPDSQLVISGSSAADEDIRVGADGINTDVAGELVPDVDIFPNGVANLELVGGSGRNELRADGAQGTGPPLRTPLTLTGGGDADRLVGGEGSDSILGLGGADRLLGAGGDDLLLPGSGDDAVNGGPGTDAANYLSGMGAGVTVDLGEAGPQLVAPGSNQTLAGVEDVFGSSLNDILRGDAGANRLLGTAGDDVLDGRGGTDTLLGGDGEDAIDARDGGRDRVDCGLQIDTVTADLEGVDELLGCERTLFPPPAAGSPAPGADAGAPAPGGGRGPGVSPPRSGVTGSKPLGDRTRPKFLGPIVATPDRFRVVPARGRRAASIGTVWRYALSEAARVTAMVERRVGGHRVRGRCRTRPAPRGSGRSCTRSIPIGRITAPARGGRNRMPFAGRFASIPLKPGTYRTRLIATDPSGNTSAPAQVAFTVLAASRGGR